MVSPDDRAVDAVREPVHILRKNTCLGHPLSIDMDMAEMRATHSRSYGIVRGV